MLNDLVTIMLPLVEAGRPQDADNGGTIEIKLTLKQRS